MFTAKWRIQLDESFDWTSIPTHHQKLSFHPFNIFSLHGPFRHIKALVQGAATSELLMSLSTASLCSGSLEPFPTYVLNSPSLKHWLFLGCSKLVSLNGGFDDGAASEWMWPAAFIFLHKYLSIFLFAKSLSLSPAQSKPFDICQDCQMVWEHVALGCVSVCAQHFTCMHNIRWGYMLIKNTWKCPLWKGH